MLTKGDPHQIRALDKIGNLQRFALFQDYGTGKSWCILAWIEENLHRQRLLKSGVLIVGKLTNIIPGGSWETEIRKHTRYEFRHLIKTDPKMDLGAMIQNMECLIDLINYEGFHNYHQQIKDRQYGTIFFDESLKLKNITTSWTKSAHKLAKVVPCIGIASGFPATEHIDDIWGQYHVVDDMEKPRLKDNYYKFLHHYFKKWRFGHTLKKEKLPEIMAAMEPNSVFVNIRDCYDLPPRLYRHIGISPSKQQMDLIRKLREDFFLEFEGMTFETKHILPTLQKEQQICSGFIYDKGKNTIHIYTPKMDALVETLQEILEQTRGTDPRVKVIIWCRYIEETKLIMDSVPKAIRNEIALVVSDMAIPERTTNLDHFKNNPVYGILLTTYDLMESGETLTMAKYAIDYGHTWSNAVTTNSKRRNYRRGSDIHDKIIYIDLYIKDTIDEVIVDALRKKKNMMATLKQYMMRWR